MQTLFRESSGAMFHPVTITSSYSGSLAASAITWQDSENSFLRVKARNFVINLLYICRRIAYLMD
jgi:alpha-N-arabinofuranosidase